MATRTHRTRLVLRALAALALLGLGAVSSEPVQTVRLRATADIWLSDANDGERNTSAGKASQLKLKTIQEMAAIRFDASPARGREVLRAALFLHRAGPDRLRYLRLSTVNADWTEGEGTASYGPPDGATFLLADAAARRPWAWPGSSFCDVTFSSGNSLAAWAERKELPGGWVSVPLPPELVYALVAGDSDGLALQDGGDLTYWNNFLHSVQSGANAPYLEVELGRPLNTPPAAPQVKAEPAPVKAHLATGALRVTIDPADSVCCYRVSLDGKPIERWKVKHPAAGQPTSFVLDDLPPGKACALEVTAVAPGGAASRPMRVTVAASPALPAPPRLEAFHRPGAGAEPPVRDGKLIAWAYPGLVKVSPERPEVMCGDQGPGEEYRRANAVWDGRQIRLFGARGEYVDYQLCLERVGGAALAGVQVIPQSLVGPNGASIAGADIELFRNWYARNRDKKWQPAYCLPLGHGAPFPIPDPQRALAEQQNQSLYVDLYVPKNAPPGAYRGAVRIEAEGVAPFSLPVELVVLDFALPDQLAFWPELNCYRVPQPAQAYYRMAHQHRCVFNPWCWAPQVQGSGKEIRIVWDDFDRNVGPLLTGEAFKNNRRAGVPQECMYLPFEDSWPTPLSRETYNYAGRWPGRGESNDLISEHYRTAPYIGDALSQSYKDAFVSAERQFIEHFREKGYTRTEMQCFFGGKNTHRTQYGSNMWWTTDEPYHWDDWLALQFFTGLWSANRSDASPVQWAARGDISRPQWQGTTLAGRVNTVYFGIGASSSPDQARRCRTLAEETGLKFMTYGSANSDNTSNTGSVAWLLNVWAIGGNGALPWQTLGDEGALDNNDASSGGGNSLLVPGKRFGLDVVGDMRLKALRDGEQIVEYLTLLCKQRGLRREQVVAMLAPAMAIRVAAQAGAGADNADALRFGGLPTWQIAELRRALAKLIAPNGPQPPAPAGPAAEAPAPSAAATPASGVAPERPAAPAQERGKAQAVMVPQGPRIDGTLADPVWRKAAVLALGDATGEGPARFATTARVLFDPRFLSLGLECAEPETAGLKKGATARDGMVWEDDCVEAFLQADPERGYRHFGVNACGALFDQACPPQGEKDARWNANAQAKVSIEPNKRWTATLAIPLADLDAYVGKGQSWRLNLTRCRPARGGVAAQEYSWAILPTSDFHEPLAFGEVTGVEVPERPDGVTRRRATPVAEAPKLQVNNGVRAGDVTVYYKPDFSKGTEGFEAAGQAGVSTAPGLGEKALDVRRIAPGGEFGVMLPTAISGSRGLKVAFLARAIGMPEIGVNLYDQVAGDNTTARGYRCLPNPYVPPEKRWQPVVYYADTFRYNGGPNSPENNVRAQTFYQNIRFYGERPGAPQTSLLLDRFVVYRGHDGTPPSRVVGLAAQEKGTTIALSWQPADDNTAIMLYVVARADGPQAPFRKIAETFGTAYTDQLPRNGVFRYRVLACDFEDDAGEWSEGVKGECTRPLYEFTDFSRQPAAVEVSERPNYAENVRRIAAAGAGKVDRNLVFCYGDSLTAATSYPCQVESALGTKKVVARGYPSRKTDWGREHAVENLERDHPAIALILFGTNNGKDPESIKKAMEDVKGMAALAAERGIIPVFGTIPPRGFTDPDSKPEAAYNQALIQTCRELQVPCAHLFEEYRRNLDRRKLIASDGVHNTAEGMAASARAWARSLAQVEWVLRDRP